MKEKGSHIEILKCLHKCPNLQRLEKLKSRKTRLCTVSDFWYFFNQGLYLLPISENSSLLRPEMGACVPF